MEIFPTQYSTLSSRALQDRIAQSYGLKDLSCRFYLHGVSDTYIMNNHDTKYIFKIYRSAHRSLSEIQGEVELLNALQVQGAKVAYPLSDQKGEQIQAFQAAEGIRHGVLFTYAKGQSVYDLSDRQLRIVGQEMAFNHNIVSRLHLQHERPSYTLDSTIVRPLQRLEAAFSEYMEGYAYLRETAEKVIGKMETFSTEQFSAGYCHYDYLPKNFHFDADDNLTLFDFDFAGKGYLVNDHVSILVHYFLHQVYKGISREEADRAFGVFLESYRNARPLSEAEQAAIPYLGFMFWVFYLGFQYNHFDDWSNPFFGTKFLKDRTALIKRWVDLYCQF